MMLVDEKRDLQRLILCFKIEVIVSEVFNPPHNQIVNC
jgi:hypothetical protein